MVSETWIRLMPVDDLAPGEMVGIDLGEHKIAVYNGGGVYFATDNICTHAFALLSDGWFEDGVVECPLHGGRFDIITGAALSEPAECALKIYQTKVVEAHVTVLMPS